MYPVSGRAAMDHNCGALETIQSFKDYVHLLRNFSDNSITAQSLSPCRKQICQTIYGTGNSDVSGIGVIVGYFIEFGLALLLSLAVFTLTVLKKDNLAQSCRKIMAAYADSAIALVISVELASAIMLIKKNFGLGAYDFGGLTVQIVWIVATLVMLPIVPFCWHDSSDKRFAMRLCMIAISLVLFLVTFICRMISTYSDQQIGSGSSAVLTQQEANQIQLLCFGSRTELSRGGNITVEIFSVGGSLWIACNILIALIDQCVMNNNDGDERGNNNTDASEKVSLTRFWQKCTLYLRDERKGTILHTFALIVWSAPLYWGLMTLRSWQEQFAVSIGSPNGSDVWSFGQIIAVVVFLPVLSESWQQYLESKEIAEEFDEGGREGETGDDRNQKTVTKSSS